MNEKIEYKGYDIEIEQDDDVESPREWDNLGTMTCFHRRYALGDKNNYITGKPYYATPAELKKYVENDKHIFLPLYLYDHGSITMNTTGFSCPWDSGQVGLIYVSKEDVRKEYGKQRVSKMLRAFVEGRLIGEVETYDQYLRGDVWGYTITEQGGDEFADSCWGFYGHGYCLNEAKEWIDEMQKENSNEKTK